MRHLLLFPFPPYLSPSPFLIGVDKGERREIHPRSPTGGEGRKARALHVGEPVAHGGGERTAQLAPSFEMGREAGREAGEV